MIKITFFLFGDIQVKNYSNYSLMTSNNLGIWNKLKGTSNVHESDIIVFMEGVSKNFDMNLLVKKKVICFPREPFVNKNYEKFKFSYGFTYNNFYHVVTNPQFINKDYDFLSGLKYNEHSMRFSAIISNKSGGPSYKLRRNVLIMLSQKYPKLCDIYGYGWKNELGVSYKGQLGYYHKTKDINKKSKYDALIDYKYTLCIENCAKKKLFFRKITDLILCWCIPIYYGCPNIEDYLPKHSFYKIDIKDPNCIENIKEIINKPITAENITALETAREMILNKYNVWPTIENILTQKKK